MNIETVNELIASLESAGELSIKERKYLDLAKAYADKEAESVALALTFEKCREIVGCPAGVDLQDWVKKLAAENVALKAAFNKPDAWLSWHSIPPTYQEPDRGGEYLAVHEHLGEKNDDGSDSLAVYSKPDLETPATDLFITSLPMESNK
ncbi:hypothetical protein AB3X34_04535 [Raoultella terrigena]|uniref:hypothetical protein n=1 Tax=Raoultella terrigena TaxID=577 RepID=UPI00349F28DB